MAKRTSAKFFVGLNTVCVSLALVAIGSQVPASAQTSLMFLANTPVTALNKAQTKSLSEAIKKSLEAGVNGQTSEWSGGSERAPSAKITPHFTDNKPPCAIVDLDITAKGATQPLKMSYCQNEKGVWTITAR